jgi:hypothetical protein
VLYTVPQILAGFDGPRQQTALESLAGHG